MVVISTESCVEDCPIVGGLGNGVQLVVNETEREVHNLGRGGDGETGGWGEGERGRGGCLSELVGLAD